MNELPLVWQIGIGAMLCSATFYLLIATFTLMIIAHNMAKVAKAYDAWIEWRMTGGQPRKWSNKDDERADQY